MVGHAAHGCSLSLLFVFVLFLVLMGPAAIMAGLSRTKFFSAPANVRYLKAAEVFVVTACLWGALPLSIGLFPQMCQTRVKDLEPQFHNLKDKNGRPIETVQFNKGL